MQQILVLHRDVGPLLIRCCASGEEQCKTQETAAAKLYHTQARHREILRVFWPTFLQMWKILIVVMFKLCLERPVYLMMKILCIEINGK